MACTGRSPRWGSSKWPAREEQRRAGQRRAGHAQLQPAAGHAVRACRPTSGSKPGRHDGERTGGACVARRDPLANVWRISRCSPRRWCRSATCSTRRIWRSGPRRRRSTSASSACFRTTCAASAAPPVPISSTGLGPVLMEYRRHDGAAPDRASLHESDASVLPRTAPLRGHRRALHARPAGA